MPSRGAMNGTGFQPHLDEMRAILDQLDIGVLLCRPDLAVVARNAAAAAILKEDDGLTESQGRLAVAQPAEGRALARLMSRVASRRGDGALGISRPSDGRPYIILVSAARDGEGRAGLLRVFVIDLARRSAFGSRPLAEVFRLTNAEGSLLAQLAQGRALSDAARTAGVSLNTMRGTLRNVFRKTGLNRQADLVRVAALVSILVDFRR